MPMRQTRNWLQTQALTTRSFRRTRVAGETEVPFIYGAGRHYAGATPDGRLESPTRLGAANRCLDTHPEDGVRMTMRLRVRRTRTAIGLAALLGLSGLSSRAQSVISAQSGLIYYTEGRVLLNDRAVQRIPGRYAQMQPHDVLRSRTGKGEVLLSPGTFLRIRENSAVRLLSDSLEAPQFEVLSGSIILETGEVKKGASTVAVWRGVKISPAKKGMFRLDTNPAALRVFEGEAVVTSGGKMIKVGKGRVLPFSGAWSAIKFDRAQTDAFDRWSGRRALSLARADGRVGRGGRGRMRRWIYPGSAPEYGPVPPASSGGGGGAPSDPDESLRSTDGAP